MSLPRAAADRSEPPPYVHKDARADGHQARRAEMILRLAAPLSGVALDYGAGWGDLTARLSPQFTRITGVDVDPKRVAFAQREFAPIAFSVCTRDTLDFPDATFDVVFSVAVLPFVPSPEAYLAECRRVLRPHGSLVVMIGNPDSMWMLGRRWLGRKPYTQEWGGATRSEFVSFLKSCGFVAEEERGFYDPPTTHLKGVGDVAIALMNLAGNTLRMHGRWSYVGYRCRLA